MRSGHKYLFPIFVAVICASLTTPAGAAFTATKTLYVDGVRVGSVNSPVGLVYTYDRITLASEGNRWSMYNTLDGALDEFSIYPGILSDQDVNDHYTAAQIDEPNYTAEVATENPLIYLRFEDADMNDLQVALNTGGSADVNGTYISDNITPVTGKFGTAADFAGNAARGCVDIYDGGDRPFSLEDISIEVWVKSTALDTDFPRLFQHNGDWLNELAYGVLTDANDSNVMQVGVVGGSTTDFFDVQAYDINNGEWHQIVVTYDSTFDPCGYPNEIAPDNPLIWFKFEEEIGPDVNVVNHGSLTIDANYIGPDPFFAPGKVGKGVFLHGRTNDNPPEAVCIYANNYDGQNDYSHLYAVTPGDISVELWFRSRPYYEYLGNDLDYGRLFSNNGTWDNNQSGRVMLTYSGYGMFGGGGDDADSGMWMGHPGYDPCAPDPNLTGPGDGDWHYVVATFDVNDTNSHDPNTDPPTTLRFYLDGALLNSRVQEPNEPLNMNGILGPEFREFLIGSEANSGNLYNCFKGTLDEVAIYNYILPMERIVVHYKEGLAAESWKPETCEQIYLYGWNKPADRNGDCYVNFEDIVATGADWWRCVEPGDESCDAPWED